MFANHTQTANLEIFAPFLILKWNITHGPSLRQYLKVYNAIAYSHALHIHYSALRYCKLHIIIWASAFSADHFSH